MALLLETPEILEIEDQEAFNLAVWERLLESEELRDLPYRVETDRLGQLIMSPSPSFDHGANQSRIAVLLSRLLPDGIVITECPLSTTEGVKAIDIAWISKARLQPQRGRVCLTKSPEICVEVLSPNNSKREMKEKRRLYFEAGAEEVWFRDRDGRMQFFMKASPEEAGRVSVLCPEFPPIVAE